MLNNGSPKENDCIQTETIGAMEAEDIARGN